LILETISNYLLDNPLLCNTTGGFIKTSMCFWHSLFHITRDDPAGSYNNINWVKCLLVKVMW